MSGWKKIFMSMSCSLGTSPIVSSGKRPVANESLLERKQAKAVNGNKMARICARIMGLDVQTNTD